MQLLLEHSQKGKVFSLWVKYELLAQEHNLVDKYNVRKVVFVEGNPSQERERAMKLAIGLSVVVFLLGFAAFGQPVAGITVALIAFPIDCHLLSYSRNHKIGGCFKRAPLCLPKHHHAAREEAANERDGREVYAVFRASEELGRTG